MPAQAIEQGLCQPSDLRRKLLSERRLYCERVDIVKWMFGYEDAVYCHKVTRGVS